MSLNRYAKKRDAAEPAIVEALERAGFDVWQQDMPDLLVRRQSWPPGMVQLLEVKTGTAKIRKEQEVQRNFIESTKTPIVRTPIEALKAVGAIS